MNVLDRSLFSTTVKLVALSVKKEECECVRSDSTWFLKIRSLVESYLLNFPRKKNIVVDKNDPSKRLLLLNQSISSLSLYQIPESIRKTILNLKDVRVTDYSLDLDYTYYTASEVFPKNSLDIGLFQSITTYMYTSHILRKSWSSCTCKPSGWATSL